jgi:tetratricopeptide (TPR) repeat protein
MKRYAICSFLTFLVLAAPLSARAQPAEEREAQARGLFALGKFGDALDLYARLYAETAHPTYQRNIGRCYQNLGEADKAITAFREYLRQAGKTITPAQRTQVEGYIREMEDLKAKRQAAAAPSAAPAPPPVRPAAKPEPDLSAHLASEAGSGRRTGAWVVGGVSVVALGVGSVFGLRAIALGKESDPHCPHDVCDDVGFPKHQDALTAARVSDVAFGVGLVGAGVALYLFLGGDEHDERSRETAAARVRLLPAVGAHDAGLVMGGSW